MASIPTAPATQLEFSCSTIRGISHGRRRSGLQHRLLRAAHIMGWKANQWVSCGTAGYWVDVLFRRHRLILEIDGWETHGTRLAFEEDRRRRNYLVLAGYAVLNFTYRQLVEEPQWVIDCIRHATR